MINSKVFEYKSIIERYYKNSYADLFSKGSCGFLWKFIHKKMEIQNTKEMPDILEIGSGAGQHLEFVRNKYHRYYMTDLDISYLQCSSDSNIVIQKEDVLSLTFPDSSFDHVIVTCVLLHVPNPEVAISEIYRVLKPQGTAVIYLPCEPGLFFNFMRKITVERKMTKLLNTRNSKIVHYMEHRATYQACSFFIKDIFGKGGVLKVYRFPFRFNSWNANLFSIYYLRK